MLALTYRALQMQLSQLWTDKTGSLPKQMECHKIYTEFSLFCTHKVTGYMFYTQKIVNFFTSLAYCFNLREIATKKINFSEVGFFHSMPCLLRNQWVKLQRKLNWSNWETVITSRLLLLEFLPHTTKQKIRVSDS